MSKELELDDLKKSWQEQEDSKNQYSQAELILMLNKKSSNNIKYIVIISLIEFIVLILSLFFTSTDKSEVVHNLDTRAKEIYVINNQISKVLLYVNIIISFSFVFFFYKSYKKINILNSTKDLINNILKFRKRVNWFIFTNITLGLLTLFLTGFYDFMSGFIKEFESTSGMPLNIEKVTTTFFFSPQYIISFFIICLLMIVIVIAYYYLVYGILLKKLKKNLDELKKFEEE